MNEDKRLQLIRTELGREPTPQEVMRARVNPHYRITFLEKEMEELRAKLDAIINNK